MRLLQWVCVSLVLVVSGEGLAWWLGFGQPPLAQRDEDTGYRLVENQSYRRFGNLIRINRYGMRSDDFDRDTRGAKRHIVLVGDSIVYGEHRVDQAQTIASQLQAIKRSGGDVDWLVSALAVSSWGPANQLAFLKKFGPFSAELCVLVISSHDLSAGPVSADRQPPYRQHAPFSALADLLTSLWSRLVVPDTRLAPGDSPSEAYLRDLLDLLAISYPKVMVVFHPTRYEHGGTKSGGAEEIVSRLAHRSGASFLSLREALVLTAGTVDRLYRDDLHLTAEGNAAVADAIHKFHTRQ